MPYASADKRRAYQRERKRQERAGGRVSPIRVTLLDGEQAAQTAEDVLSILEEQITLVRNDRELSSTERARCVGYLCGITLRAIEVRDVAQRLERLESVIDARERFAS